MAPAKLPNGRGLAGTKNHASGFYHSRFTIHDSLSFKTFVILSLAAVPGERISPIQSGAFANQCGIATVRDGQLQMDLQLQLPVATAMMAT